MNTIEKMYNELFNLKQQIEKYKVMLEKVYLKDQEFLLDIKHAQGNAIELAKMGYAYAEFRRERRLLKGEYESLITQYHLLGGQSKLTQLKEYCDIKNVPKKNRPFHRKMEYYKNFTQAQQDRMSKCFHII